MDNGEETREQRIASGAEGIKLDPQEVKEFIASLGYEADAIAQHHRHAYSKVYKNGEQYFFKMASTPAVAPKLTNEIAWNALINQKALPFRTPRVIESGENQDLAYYIAEYIEGPLLAAKTKRGTQNLAGELERIVTIIRSINNLPMTPLPLDAGHTLEHEAARLTQSAARKVGLLKDFGDLKPLIELVEVLKNGYETGLTHGDLTPWSIIKHAGGWVLVDGEHATSLRPKFIDVAQFYMRVYIQGENPEASRMFLKLFRQELANSELAEFNRTIRPLIAHRTINVWRDAQLGGRSDIDLHQRLRDDILNDRLFG